MQKIHMHSKNSILLVLLLIFSNLYSMGDEEFPDLSKFSPNGKLKKEPLPDPLEGYSFSLVEEKDFSEMKENLRKFLGKEWTEEEIDPRVYKATLEIMQLKIKNNELLSYAYFNNPAFPNSKISFHVIKLVKFKKKNKISFIINVSITNE